VEAQRELGSLKSDRDGLTKNLALANTSSPETRDNLHEITLRSDRPAQTPKPG